MIDHDTLDAIARHYIGAMTSIRGRRVHRLVMRTLARFDHVVAAVTENGEPALLALSDDGGAALCCTDGRGAAADVVEWASLQGAAITTSHDLLKDSLPIVRWTIRHPGFAGVAGMLTISAAELSPDDRLRIAEILRRRSR